jgi:large subunit ribosomal protein L22
METEKPNFKKLPVQKEEKKEQRQEAKEEIKKETAKKKTDEKKKTEAVVNGRNLPVSLKHAIALCNFIRDRDIDRAIGLIEDASKMKIAVPMRGEIPHRKGMMSGRYPQKAAGIILKLLKSLKANAIVNELELEKYKIYCSPNSASRPYRRFGQGRFKRVHLTIKLIPLSKQKNK